MANRKATTTPASSRFRQHAGAGRESAVVAEERVVPVALAVHEVGG